jgi:S1-C subfamily serine protease
MTPNDIAKRIIFFLLLLIAFHITWNRLAPQFIGVSATKKSIHLHKDSIMRAEETGRLIGFIAEHASKSVVSIKARGSEEALSFLGRPLIVNKEGRGTGIIIDKKGLIVTNAHLVAGYDEFRVLLKDGREFEALYSEYDSVYDVAILKIEGDSFPACAIGESNRLQPGEWILAIGNPMGLNHSVTFGIISGVGRTDTLENGKAIDYIQTDAAINQGNSGGPLINLDGDVVGMTTFIMSPTGGSAGVGFAIPIKRVLERISRLSTQMLLNNK